MFALNTASSCLCPNGEVRAVTNQSRYIFPGFNPETAICNKSSGPNEFTETVACAALPLFSGAARVRCAALPASASGARLLVPSPVGTASAECAWIRPASGASTEKLEVTAGGVGAVLANDVELAQTAAQVVAARESVELDQSAAVARGPLARHK